MSTVHVSGGSVVQYTKGAPDEVLKKCVSYLDHGKVCPMTEEKMQEILAANKEMADKALRVLAAAARWWETEPTDFSPEALENELCFIGLTGMIDPVRPEVKAAIEECRGAGIRPIMITGDHIDTAVAIAKELGILKDASEAVTGSQLDAMDDEEFERRFRDISVYARVQPEHKTRIVTAWKRAGYVTADDRRRRQRRAEHKERGHRRGHGHHRYGRYEERRRHGAGGRQLRHNRGRGGGRPPDL